MKLKSVTRACITRTLARRPQVPACKHNGITIKISTTSAGEQITVVSWRNAILMGMQPLQIRMDVPLLTRVLSDANGVWMTDSLQELWQAEQAVSKLRGRVLIGGLGLGIATTFASYNPKVSSICTVEKDKNIVDLVQPHLATKCRNCHIDDLFLYLTHAAFGYDSAFFDIWRGTGEYTWKEYIVPLRRLCRNRIKKVFCWQEDEMLGQMRNALPIAACLGDMSMVNYYQPLVEYVRQKNIARPELPDPKADNFAFLVAAHSSDPSEYPALWLAVEHYCRPGTDRWEKDFGDLWDRFVGAEDYVAKQA